MKKKVRYAVIGLGHIAEVAVLPAFSNSGNSVLAALISDDPAKLRRLGERYGVRGLYSYDRFDECMSSGEVDALYIALPNHLHAEYTIRAARFGVHVLCEKPMAVTAKECQSMIRACQAGNVRLMVAYRLQLEKANQSAIRLVRSGRIGEPRLFNSIFTMNVTEGNVRLQGGAGGGPLYDVGIYCLNAARHLFGEEPTEVIGTAASGDDGRFGEVEEMLSATIRFPQNRLATFLCSFGATFCGEYRVVGTKGSIRLAPAFDYARELKQTIVTAGKQTHRTFAKSDQFATELTYFSRCIQRGVDPEPSGREGLADVRVIEALYRSVATSRPVALPPWSSTAPA